jgi:hypothetical protein
MGLVPSSRPAVKKSHARIASAWDRRNCDQVGTDRRDAGSIPAFLRISRTVEAVAHPGNLGGHETWEDAGSWRHRRSTPMSCANAR